MNICTFESLFQNFNMFFKVSTFNLHFLSWLIFVLKDILNSVSGCLWNKWQHHFYEIRSLNTNIKDKQRFMACSQEERDSEENGSVSWVKNYLHELDHINSGVYFLMDKKEIISLHSALANQQHMIKHFLRSQTLNDSRYWE